MRSFFSEITHLIHQGADQFGFKDVAQWNPVEEAQQRLQRGVNQRSILGILLQQPKEPTHRRKDVKLAEDGRKATEGVMRGDVCAP